MVIPLRSSVSTVEVLAPAVTVGGHGEFVMCTDELFAIDVTALKGVVAKLSAGDRLKVRPALDKLFGDY